MKTVLFILLLSPVILWAQMIKITPDDTYRKQSYLTMRDGSVVRGQIIRQDSSLITVKVRGGDFSFIEADQVVRISPDRPGNLTSTDNAPAPYSLFVFRDGSQIEGNYVRRDSTMITVRKRNGQLTYFEPELLVRVDSVRAEQASFRPRVINRETFANRFSPWLLTGQTAYNAEKGRLYYRNTLLILNELDYGITRNWSVGINTNPFFASIQPTNSARESVIGANVRFSSKFTVPIGEEFRFGVNATYQPKQTGYYYAFDQQVILNGVLSFGSSQRNATLGYGMQLHPDGYSNDLKFITAGVMHKLSRSLTFVSDNTFYLNPYYSGSSAILSVALRIDRRRHAFDLGAFSSIYPYRFYNQNNTSSQAYFAPYLGYNLIIGHD